MTQRPDGKATAVPNRLPRWASGVTYAACGWAFVFAALSCSWALEGTVGTQTVSPAMVQLARAHDPWVHAALWLSAFLKVLSGIVVLALIQPWGRKIPRWLLLMLAWGAGTLLFVHGGLYLGVGLLAITGVIALPQQESDPAFFKILSLRITVAFSTSPLLHRFSLAKKTGSSYHAFQGSDSW